MFWFAAACSLSSLRRPEVIFTLVSQGNVIHTCSAKQLKVSKLTVYISVLIDWDFGDLDSLHCGLICSFRFMGQGMDDCTFIFSGKFNTKWNVTRTSTILYRYWIIFFPICQVTAPYLHIGGVALMTLLSWPIAFHVFRLKIKGKNQNLFVGVTTKVNFSIYFL